MNSLRLQPSLWPVVAAVLLGQRLLSASSAAALAFRLPSFPPLPKLLVGLGGGMPRRQQQQPKAQQARIVRQQLLQALAGTDRGKTATVAQQRQVLRLVRQLEVDSPAPSQLLTDPDTAQRYLNGTWYLQYTSPSQIINDGGNDDDESRSTTTSATTTPQQSTTQQWTPEYATEGDANIPTTPFQARGSISAAGVTIDTSSGQVQQTIDCDASRVENIVLNNNLQIRAAGTFRPSQNVPTRAVVSFDTLQLQFGTPNLTLELGWLFAAIGALRNSRENGWLETTYVDDQVRIGRGNKGTLFVLTRDANGST